MDTYKIFIELLPHEPWVETGTWLYERGGPGQPTFVYSHTPPKPFSHALRAKLDGKVGVPR